MRVGLVIYGTLDTVSGGYLYDRALVQHLRACGDEVEIVALPWRNYASHIADNLDRAWQARLDEVRCDVLLQDQLNHPSLLRANARLRGRLPIVSIVHHLRSDERHPQPALALYREVERAYVRSVDAFVYNSRTTRESVERLLGARRRHIVAYPAGDRFTAAARAQSGREAAPDRPLQLLAVGNVTPRKNLHVLLEALSFCEGEWRLDVAGSLQVDAAYAARVSAQARWLGIAERVHWLGGLDDAQLAAAYAASDALVGVSSYEGFGIVYIEAMGFGLPVIASTAGAAREIVTDGVDGYLVGPDDMRSLGLRLQGWMDQPDVLRRMGEAARRRFARHPSWHDAGTRIRGFLSGMV